MSVSAVVIGSGVSSSFFIETTETDHGLDFLLRVHSYPAFTPYYATDTTACKVFQLIFEKNVYSSLESTQYTIYDQRLVRMLEQTIKVSDAYDEL